MIINTTRLSLRPFILDDFSFIIELLNSPDWIKFIGNRNVYTETDAKNYLLNGPIKSYDVNGFGLSIVALKEGDTPIGMCGLIIRDYLKFPDLGFAFLPPYLQKGYGYEIANAVLLQAINNLKFNQISAMTLPSNISSIKLLEKLNFKFEKNIVIPNDDDELMLFQFYK